MKCSRIFLKQIRNSVENALFSFMNVDVADGIKAAIKLSRLTSFLDAYFICCRFFIIIIFIFEMNKNQKVFQNKTNNEKYENILHFFLKHKKSSSRGFSAETNVFPSKNQNSFQCGCLEQLVSAVFRFNDYWL